MASFEHHKNAKSYFLNASGFVSHPRKWAEIAIKRQLSGTPVSRKQNTDREGG